MTDDQAEALRAADAATALITLTRCHDRLMTKLDEYRQLSTYRAERIREAHALGLSWQQIADALGVTRSAVSRFAKEVSR